MFSDCTEIANGKLCQSTADNNSDSNSHSIVCDFVSFYRWETPNKHVQCMYNQFKEPVIALKNISPWTYIPRGCKAKHTFNLKNP